MLSLIHILDNPIQYIANMNTPLAMLIAGANLAQSNIVSSLKSLRMYYLCALKPVSYTHLTLHIIVKAPSINTGNNISVFRLVLFLLFLYLGLENCVNGWFVTYLKSMDIMSSTYATLSLIHI